MFSSESRMPRLRSNESPSALDVTMMQRSKLDYLIYNDPLGYADLILNGDTKEYLKNVAGSHGLEDWKNIICSLRQTVDMKIA